MVWDDEYNVDVVICVEATESMKAEKEYVKQTVNRISSGFGGDL